MDFNDSQEIRICEIAEKIYWQAVNDSGGLFVEDASDLSDINNKVYEQGKLLLRYLKDITLDEEESIVIIDEDTI
jgi:hypothetical protein